MKRLPVKLEQLKAVSDYGLACIPANAWQHLCFEQGEMVTKEGEMLPMLALVLKGKAKVCCTAENGKNLILCHYLSSGLIGDVELMTNCSSATATVIAISQLECLAVDREHCIKELDRNILFLRSLGENVSRKLINSSDNFVNSALCTGKQRLCTYILQNSNRNIFCDVLTDVSCSVGISYRHLLRILNELCTEKILEKQNNGYFIKDEAKLIELSSNTIKAAFHC